MSAGYVTSPALGLQNSPNCTTNSQTDTAESDEAHEDGDEDKREVPVDAALCDVVAAVSLVTNSVSSQLRTVSCSITEQPPAHGALYFKGSNLPSQ